MIDITLPESLLFRGLFVAIGSVLVFYGSVYLLLYTNLGKKLGFRVAGVGLFGWTALNSLLFIMYAPRGPRPREIEGLNAFEIRIIPTAFFLVSMLLFAMFAVSLHRLETSEGD
ncbi:MAG: sugar transferase [Acidimicrobiia bacterium]|nr:sugar transferase [Acidimicrobiia bacterium]MBT8249644.1 sugar transferase [Acidimicrobiia bacterium]NNC42172.1 sugar transferase [Acidimicrobiia bacterium]NNL27817.1 sugar transferase [Acidimicrobiia bacterium]NNL47624.1 sugar transferase [Acidimicrobiia bacterium]